MTAAPVDLVSEMQAIDDHWHEGRWLYATGQFTEDERSEHEAITMSAVWPSTKAMYACSQRDSPLDDQRASNTSETTSVP